MIPDNAWGTRITAAAGTSLATPYSWSTINHDTNVVTFSSIKDVYVPKNFIHHAASLRQTFVHCGRFSTAATRRCMGRVSVPSVGVTLSGPLSVIALVSHYLTNKLILRRPLQKRIASLISLSHLVLPRLSVSYARLLGTFLRVTTSSATEQLLM